MSMKRKDFSPKKEVKRWKTDWYREEKGKWKAFQNPVKKLSFDNKVTFLCFVLQHLHALFIRPSKIGP